MCQRNNIEGGLLVNEQNGHQSLYMFSAMMKGHISSHVDSTKNVGEDKSYPSYLSRCINHKILAMAATKS